MKNRVKITKPQIRSMYQHLEGIAFKDKIKKDDLKLFYHPLTPNDVYVKYTIFQLEPDNSIYSEVVVRCIKSDGSLENCTTQFDNLKQRMEFESDFVEIDLDANGNLIFV